MPTLPSAELPISSFWQWLVSLVFADPAKLLNLVSTLHQYIRSHFERGGIYEVLEHDIRLELCDSSGASAIYYKRQKVRFLQNNVIAFQDQAWGDGDIFAEYQCSPGVPVDRYREGHRYRILISLRQSKQRGDIEEFHIQRTIRNGFTKPTEDLQTEIDHKTKVMTMTVIFPETRWMKRIALIEQKSARIIEIGTEHIRKLPDGRQQVQWQLAYPKQFEAYFLHWEW